MAYKIKNFNLILGKSFFYQKSEEFVNSERLADEVLSLPVHPLLSQREVEKIVTSVNKFLE